MRNITNHRIHSAPLHFSDSTLHYIPLNYSTLHFITHVHRYIRTHVHTYVHTYIHARMSFCISLHSTIYWYNALVFPPLLSSEMQRRRLCSRQCMSNPCRSHAKSPGKEWEIQDWQNHSDLKFPKVRWSSSVAYHTGLKCYKPRVSGERDTLTLNLKASFSPNFVQGRLLAQVRPCRNPGSFQSSFLEPECKESLLTSLNTSRIESCMVAWTEKLTSHFYCKQLF